MPPLVVPENVPTVAKNKNINKYFSSEIITSIFSKSPGKIPVVVIKDNIKKTFFIRSNS